MKNGDLRQKVWGIYGFIQENLYLNRPDMKIINLKTPIDYLNTLENRVTAVHIGKSDYGERFVQSTKARKNISIFFVERREDIPKIVLGQIGEYFNPSSGL